MKSGEIDAAGLLLRPWRSDDAGAVLAALRESEIRQWNPSPAADLDDARRWIERRADWSGGDHVSLAVVDPASEGLVGSVSLHQIFADGASIGYWTVRAARGRQVASRALTALTEWAFRERGIHRIELCHAVANPASCRVALRAGYALEGTLRESHRFGDGRRYDEHVHGRLATDA